VAAGAAEDVGLDLADDDELLWLEGELSEVPEDPVAAESVAEDLVVAASDGPESAGFPADREVFWLFRESLL